MYQSINKYVSRDDKDDITISHWAKHLLIDCISYKFDSKSKIIFVILNFNEKINTSLKTVNNKESNIEIDYSNKMIYKQVGKKYHSSLFEKFIDEYFYWTLVGIEDMDNYIRSHYDIELKFGYEMGVRSPKYSKEILNIIR